MQRVTRMMTGVTGALAVAGVGMGMAVAPAQAAPAPRACTASQLAISVHDRGAAGGHQGVVLVFVNKSRTTCTMTGYAGVAGVDTHGRQVVQAQRSPGGYLFPGVRVRTVTVQPGRWATAGLEWIDNPQQHGRPATVHSLLVTPPNSATSVPVALPATVKNPVVWSPFAIHPTV